MVIVSILVLFLVLTTVSVVAVLAGACEAVLDTFCSHEDCFFDEALAFGILGMASWEHHVSEGNGNRNLLELKLQVVEAKMAAVRQVCVLAIQCCDMYHNVPDYVTTLYPDSLIHPIIQ